MRTAQVGAYFVFAPSTPTVATVYCDPIIWSVISNTFGAPLDIGRRARLDANHVLECVADRGPASGQTRSAAGSTICRLILGNHRPARNPTVTGRASRESVLSLDVLPPPARRHRRASIAQVARKSKNVTSLGAPPSER